MVETIHSVCQNDPEKRSEHNDNGQSDTRRIQRRTGDKNKGHFYLGTGRKSGYGNDKKGERQRSEQNEH